MKKNFKEYIKTIKEQDFDKSTEYTFRTPFEILIKSISNDIDKKIKVIHERKREKFGQPDFKVLKSEGLIGYIETKPIKDNLDEYISTEQIDRYLSVSDNFLLTNYRNFIYFKNGVEVIRDSLFQIDQKGYSENKVEIIYDIIVDFLTKPVKKITSPEKLSSFLSKRTRLLRRSFREYYIRRTPTPYKQKLHSLFELFKETLVEDMSEDDFFDMCSQTVTYGLFLSKLNTQGKIDKETSFLYIPNSLSVIREIFELIRIRDIPQSISWVIDEILDVLNIVDSKKLRENLSFGKDFGHKDPYVYFYEDFLKQYDNQIRKKLGVYYTPIPVVHFIIESINEILKNDFNKTGFDDDGITTLDFSCGTGTFLLETYKKTLENIDDDLKKYLDSSSKCNI